MLAAQPNLAKGHYNLGNALAGQRRLDETVAAYRQAIRIKPDFAEAHSNLGNALTAQGNLAEAVVRVIRRAVGFWYLLASLRRCR